MQYFCFALNRFGVGDRHFKLFFENLDHFGFGTPAFGENTLCEDNIPFGGAVEIVRFYHEIFLPLIGDGREVSGSRTGNIHHTEAVFGVELVKVVFDFQRFDQQQIFYQLRILTGHIFFLYPCHKQTQE